MSINIYIYLYAVFEKLRKSVFGGGYPSVFIGVLLKENMVERERVCGKTNQREVTFSISKCNNGAVVLKAARS